MNMNLSAIEARRLAIIRLANALDRGDGDGYAAAYSSLVILEQQLGEYDEEPEGVCRVCGCTDEFGCEEGCSWGDAYRTVCTACISKADDIQLVADALAVAGRQLAPVILVGWSHDERLEALRWAWAAQRHADDPQVGVPPIPAHLTA